MISKQPSNKPRKSVKSTKLSLSNQSLITSFTKPPTSSQPCHANYPDDNYLRDNPHNNPRNVKPSLSSDLEPPQKPCMLDIQRSTLKDSGLRISL